MSPMETPAARLVPKVHPMTRGMEPDDPLSLHATPVEGDPEALIRAVVQEYAWMGFDLDEIVTLFRDPFYPMLHGLWVALGEAGIRGRIDAVLRCHGVYRFRSTIFEAPDEDEPDLVQIGPSKPEGHRHAAGL